MKTKEGLLLDIVVGVIGALIGGFLLSFVVDTANGGWWFTCSPPSSARSSCCGCCAWSDAPKVPSGRRGTTVRCRGTVVARSGAQETTGQGHASQALSGPVPR